MNKQVLLITFMLSSLSLVACAEEQVNVVKSDSSTLPEKHQIPPPSALDKGSKKVQKWHTGKLQFINLEGGFYGFIGDNGERLLPLGLDKKYRQHGAEIKILGYIDKDIMTIQQWGQPFKVLKVEMIKEGTKVPPSDNI